MHFVIKLFPEIIIKSTPVRKRMTRQLRENLRKMLRAIDPAIQVEQDWEKLQVMGPKDEDITGQVADLLARTPGIANFSKVQHFPLGSFDDILEKTLAVWKEKLEGKTFVLRVKRSGKHDFTSGDVERIVGGGLLHGSEAAGVSLKQPDITVRLEIKQQELFVIEETTQGLGGFPLGSQDTVISLISGGFDSTVSSYLTTKRGLRTHYLFFNLGGRAHEVGVKEVAFYLWNKFGSSHRVRFVTVPFEGVVGEILSKVRNSEMGVVLKRMMLRAATEVAEEMGVQALVTGESVAQVSSQTLANLAVIDSVTKTLVLRPLITSDKNDIIDIARAIGTEQFAASMPEYCGVISVKPTTRAREDKVVAEEANFDFSVLEQAVANSRVQNIDEVMEADSTAVDVEIFQSPQPGATILDIRHPDEVELRPLSIQGVPVRALPFFTLQTTFQNLEQADSYMLYCEKGVMSRLHAELLLEQGFQNVAVYRPNK
ncbi:MAG: tRNA 4-thiouridine(8) synthase ThiI [Gammaproteobacteria bacterium]|nr:MAG: tRNA 4-thiouridine(8) synthase ThiI [Gammaproteobacteria bacterium]